LDAATYARVKAAGFSWAPKQDLFVAPKWTPEREDLLLELCEEIEDEDITPEERAAERAERFEFYSEKREADAHRAKELVEQITDGIPLGQPILRGHHSERHARKDAEKIENGMRKAVKMWETSKYWERRAAGAIRAAKYKEIPTVRARRIKTIEAEQRSFKRALDNAEKFLGLWTAPELTMNRAKTLANFGHTGYGLWSRLDKGELTAEQARDIVVPQLESVIARSRRYVQHCELRLGYERCMLEESGYVEPPKVKSLKETLPLLNYRQDVITYPNEYRSGEMKQIPQVEMTKAEYAKIYKDYKGTRIVERSHKVRIAVVKSSFVAVFLTDSKVHVKPPPGAEPPLPAPRMPRAARPAPEPTVFDAMKSSLKAGVTVVSAPELFPTPKEISRKMARLAGCMSGMRVLEPSAGTGRLIEAIRDSATGFDCLLCVVAVEINAQLVEGLEAMRRKTLFATPNNFVIVRGDFLEMVGSDIGAPFDRVLMNPPFHNAADIAHILRARSMLKPGGRVVAICANGPRQQAQLKPLASHWEELPDGTFAEQGTNVRTVLAVFDSEQ
jgi:16S rRNA G966 N2-methylase RsmD